jgi:signal transduction histidine kinase
VEAERAGVRFHLDVVSSGEAEVSRARLERVFSNLFVNAIEAMPRGGTIEVRVESEANRVVATVRDNGPGIPPAIRASLFEPFTTAGKSNGLGLGLALSRQAVLDDGGDLSLEPSERGACFRVALPVVLRQSSVTAG